MPTNQKPLISPYWASLDEAFSDVARALRNLISERQQRVDIIETPAGAATPPPLERGQDGDPVDFSVSAVDYYCYISESKVNQLYAQISDAGTAVPDVLTLSKQIVEQRRRLVLSRIPGEQARLEVDLRRLEGRKRMLTLGFGSQPSNHAMRGTVGLEDINTLMPKFKSTVTWILLNRKVASLAAVVQRGCPLDAFCYLYCGAFHFDAFVGKNMATIASYVGGRKLLLYCSMSYFSNMSYQPDPDEGWVIRPHSLNWPFFDEKRRPEYLFKAILFVTSAKDGDILGSPLCLMLSTEDDAKL